MSAENCDTFELDVDRVEGYLTQTPAFIERGRAWTANLVTVLLVSGLLGSLPLYLIAVMLNQNLRRC